MYWTTSCKQNPGEESLSLFARGIHSVIENRMNILRYLGWMLEDGV